MDNMDNMDGMDSMKDIMDSMSSKCNMDGMDNVDNMDRIVDQRHVLPEVVLRKVLNPLRESWYPARHSSVGSSA